MQAADELERMQQCIDGYAGENPMHPEIKKMYEDYFDKCFRESSAEVPENFMDALRFDAAMQGRHFKESNMNGFNGTSADDLQYGGTHYKDMTIQPWAVMEAVLTREEFIGFLKGNIIKYSLRHGRKDSPDADKALHYMQKLKETSGSGW